MTMTRAKVVIVTAVLVIAGASGCGDDPSDEGGTQTTHPDDGVSTPTSPPSNAKPEVTQLSQDGFNGLRLRRDVSDVSVTDLESAFPDQSFVLRPENERCSTASGDGLTAIYDADTRVHAFVVDGKGFATAEGIEVGSSIAEVRERYGALVRDETETQIVIADQEQPAEEITSNSLLYVFDIDPTGQITALRAGGYPWLLGCQAP